MEMHMTPQKALETAVSLAGGQSALAEKLTLTLQKVGFLQESKKISQQSVYNWLVRQEQCPSKYARFISDVVNGEVSPSQLRPDLYPSSIEKHPAA
jgi:DNA-binding transcriptional regulator YdaS (Cro superfamily)